jgi:hypothetical protein
MPLNPVFHINLVILTFWKYPNYILDNAIIAAHLLKNRFDQDAVVEFIRGPEALRVCM